MFIASANTTGPAPAPLLDRMEVLRLSGYTEQKKERIAFDHLIPRETVEAGLQDGDCRFSPEAVALPDPGIHVGSRPPGPPAPNRVGVPEDGPGNLE